MGRTFWGICVVCLLAASALAAPETLNVDFVIGWDGCYRPQEWTPMDVGIATTIEEPQGGLIEVTAQQDSLTSMIIRHPYVVKKGSPYRVQLMGKIAYGTSTAELVLRNQKGRAEFSREVNLMDYVANRANPIRQQDFLLGVVGRKPPGLARLTDTCSTSENRQGQVFVKEKLIQGMPSDWTGFASVDTLVLYNPQYDQMTPLQAKAIHQWVSSGGRCFIVLGGRGLPDDGPLADLLPFKLKPIHDVQLNESGLPYRERLGRKATVKAWGLPNTAPEGWKIESFGSKETMLAVGQHGFGQVAVLAFDPSDLPDPTADNAAAFWANLVSKFQLSERRIVFTGNGGDQNQGRYYQDHVPHTGATNNVLLHLMSIPELRPLSIWWVIGLLALLALLLGPIDYLVLKKLDRLPLTWVTSLAIIAAFTIGAYYGVQAIRAGSMQVRAVTMIDGLADSTGKTQDAWSTSYCGIFAPASDEYKFNGLAGNGWWSAISPGQEDYYSYGRSNIGNRQLHCGQQDGGNLPQAMPISIWSMQCLVNESSLTDMPVSAVVSSAERGAIAAQVTNKSKAAIKGGFVRVGNSTIRIDRLEPGQSKLFKGDNCSDSLTLGDAGGRVSLNDCAGAYGCSDRTTTINQWVQGGKMALVCVEFEQAPLSYQVVPSDYRTHHIQVARLVVPLTDNDFRGTSND